MGVGKIEAIIAGFDGNFPKNSITNVVQSGYTIIGSTAIKGGSDIETDENFIVRILQRMLSYPRAGNIADYRRWAVEASDYVGKVNVEPIWNGNGTVRVVVLDRNDTALDTDDLNEVQNYIYNTEGSGVAPIGAEVTVVNATLVDVNVKLTINYLTGFVESIVENNVKQAITKTLKDLPIGENVLIHKLSASIFSVPGVNAISAYAISITNTTPQDSEVDDIIIAANEKAQAGTITVS